MARHDKSSVPATKADIAAIMESLGRLYDANKEWKDEILHAQERWKEEVLRHFDVVAENLHQDFVGAFNDRTEQHDDYIRDHERRLQMVEHRLGTAA